VLSAFGILILVSADPAMASHRARHRGRAVAPADRPIRRRVRAVAPEDEPIVVRPARARGALYHGILVEDADSGRVLYNYNADMAWPPASMAKMMLLLVAEDELHAGHASLSDPVRVSERAAATGGSHVGLRAGDVYPLGELMKAALIKSANDAAVAVAEKVGGSVEGCVRMMNERAQMLGLIHTNYNTVDGLPPRPGQDVDVTTALDLATVARELIHHTDLLQWSAMEEASFNEGTAVLHNTNHLIGRFEGCDGLKTGFTSQAGFNLTATAKRGDMRLIAVVLGAPSNGQRFAQAARFLEWGFNNFQKVSLVKEGEPLPIHVQTASGTSIQPIAESEVSVVVPKSEANDIKVDYEITPTLDVAPPAGTSLGSVVVKNGNSVLAKVDAVCPGPVGYSPGILGSMFNSPSPNTNNPQDGVANAAQPGYQNLQ
jgi:D-alanyl-D-alanine carboxypeptidase (penicillin-binding protein 5/6)